MMSWTFSGNTSARESEDHDKTANAQADFIFLLFAYTLFKAPFFVI